jgi:PAS domain S-box-containing protein
MQKKNAQEKSSFDTQKKLEQAEERYRALFNKSLDWVYIHDFKGHFLDANPAALKGLGYTKEEIHSLDFKSLLTKKQWRLAVKTLWELKRKGVQKNVTEYKIRRKDGGFVWVETMASVIHRAGKPDVIQGIVRVITEWKNAERKLRETEERYKALFDRSIDWIFIHDWDNNILDANQPALEVLGYSRNEMKSLKLNHIIRQDQTPKMEKIKKELKKYGHQKEREEFILLKKNGGEIHVEVLTSVLFRDEKPVAIQGVAQDITGRKLAEKRMLKSGESLNTFIINALKKAVSVE